MKPEIKTILIGGKAGEGVKKIAQVIASACLELGYYSMQTDDYQSLIKGGHNFSQVSFSSEPVYSTYKSADIVICFDQRSYVQHYPELASHGTIYYNSDENVNELGIGVPMTSLMKQYYSDGSNVSMAALAIFCAHFGLNPAIMERLIKASYKRDIDENLAFAKHIYSIVKQSDKLDSLSILQNLSIVSGNQSIGTGAWLSGLDMYFAYPMTPASSLLHFFASKSAKLGIKAIHAESELAAANMAVGAVVAGARTAVGSSGGGFALMQEAFSLAGIVEAPLLCVLSSRPGPATGVSTYTAQEDLFFALHQGHGQFDRIVASPDCYERAFTLASELLCLAWEIQIPTILLTEKHLSESLQTVVLPTDKISEANPEYYRTEQSYERYAFTDNGISPMLFPPSSQIIKWNSHEHLPSGLRTDLAEPMIAMKDKRDRKLSVIDRACRRYQRVAIYGNGAKQIFTYGSTALEVREAMKHLPDEYCLIVPIYLHPLPIDELAQYKDMPSISIEHNSRPSFATYLREKAGIETNTDILRYDGRHWDPIELSHRIKEAFDA